MYIVLKKKVKYRYFNISLECTIKNSFSIISDLLYNNKNLSETKSGHSLSSAVIMNIVLIQPGKAGRCDDSDQRPKRHFHVQAISVKDHQAFQQPWWLLTPALLGNLLSVLWKGTPVHKDLKLHYNLWKDKHNGNSQTFHRE